MGLQHLSAIHLQTFRNLADQVVLLQPGITLLHGPNGSGKTHFLEALYLLVFGRSFRTTHLGEMVRFEQTELLVRGETVPERHHIGVRITSAGGRETSLDGKRDPEREEIFNLVRAGLITPRETSLIYGDPSERRRFVDFFLSQAIPGYLKLVREFNFALKQRNLLLKARSEGAPCDDEHLFAWTSKLCELASRVQTHRGKWLDRLNGPLSWFYEQLSDGKEKIQCRYQPSVPGGEDAETLRANLLKRKREEDRFGVTMAGPHRDEIIFELGTQPARSFASGGQVQSLVLAAYLASGRMLAQAGPAPGLLLLDDPFAELDRERSTRLFALLREFPQVIVTHALQPHSDKGDFAILEIRAGQIRGQG